MWGRDWRADKGRSVPRGLSKPLSGQPLAVAANDAVGLRANRAIAILIGPELACRAGSGCYAVAYELNLNGIIAEDRVMDATSLPTVKMPNRDGFVADPRPDVR